MVQPMGLGPLDALAIVRVLIASQKILRDNLEILTGIDLFTILAILGLASGVYF